MRRVPRGNYAVIDKFGEGKDGFGAGDKAAGTIATIPGADWFNSMQEEIAGVIEGAGFKLDASRNSQLSDAIKQIIISVTPKVQFSDKTDGERHDVAASEYAVGLAAKMGMPLGSVVSFPLVVTPSGFLKCDGGTFNQVDYPELFNLLGGNKLPDLRRSDVGEVAYFPLDSIPSGWVAFDKISEQVTDSKFPELHGLLVAKYGAIANVPKSAGRYFRDTKTGLNVGETQDDAIRNITGTVSNVATNAVDSFTGAMKYKGIETATMTTGTGATNPVRIVSFDASLQVPTANENRPITLVMRACIKAQNKFDEVTFWIKATGSISYASGGGGSDSSAPKIYKTTNKIKNGFSYDASFPRFNSSYISKTDGQKTTVSGWQCTDLIPISSRDVLFNRTLVPASSAACSIAFYDGSKKYLGYYNPALADEYVEVGDVYTTAAYVAFTVSTTEFRVGVMRYAPNFIELLKHRYVDMRDYYGIEVGATWSSTGANSANPDYSRTKPIPVVKGMQFILTAGTSVIPYITLFGRNLEFLRSIAPGSNSMSAAVFRIDDADAYYVSFNFKNDVTSIGSLAIFGVPLDHKPIRFNRKKFVNFGDSISANYWCWPSHVATQLGMTHRNYAVSGSTINSALDIAQVVDYADSDLVVITHGTNDFALDTPLGTIDDAPNKSGSFYARYKWVLEQIMTNAQMARVVVCTPLHRTRPANSTRLPQNADGKTIADYAKAVRDLADAYHLPCLDLHKKSGFNDFNMATLTDDGLHPTRQTQFNILTPMFAGFLQTI